MDLPLGATCASLFIFTDDKHARTGACGSQLYQNRKESLGRELDTGERIACDNAYLYREAIPDSGGFYFYRNRVSLRVGPGFPACSPSLGLGEGSSAGRATEGKHKVQERQRQETKSSSHQLSVSNLSRKNAKPPKGRTWQVLSGRIAKMQKKSR